MKKTILFVMIMIFAVCIGAVYADGETPVPNTQDFSADELFRMGQEALEAENYKKAQEE